MSNYWRLLPLDSPPRREATQNRDAISSDGVSRVPHGRGTVGRSLTVAVPTGRSLTVAVLTAGIAIGVMVGLAGAAGDAGKEAPAWEPTRSGDVMQGWRVFHDKRCIACHAIWDQGGTVGPDLGRIRGGHLSGGQLAGVMWNHIPKMLAWMKQAGHPLTALTDSEMADIFALVYFVRQLDELGDPVQGERILREKGCTECHSIDTLEETVGPDLAKWGSYANPIIWAQMMWEHAPVMEEAMRRLGMRWPELEGDDLVHIVAYVRSAGISGDKTYLRPGSVENGRRLFLDKRCDRCHPGAGPDLAEVRLPTSVGTLASRMWNHSPAMTRVMREQDVARPPITAQELADILAYVLALANRDRGGDPARGQRVFEQKGCGQCHEAEGPPEGGVPGLPQLSRSASAVQMAAAMWNHGETMLEKMTEAGMSWPVFADNEMVDLLAYLKTLETPGNDHAAPGKEEAQ